MEAGARTTLTDIIVRGRATPETYGIDAAAGEGVAEMDSRDMARLASR